MKRTVLALLAFVGVTLSVHASLVYSNSFGYPDGALDTVSVGSPLGLWYWHSGITNQLQVVGGQAVVGGANTEDMSSYITNSAFPLPFANGPGNGSLYASFTINMTALPAGSGGTYFFHFRDTGTMNFRARTWAATNGAAAGNYRVGISAAGNTTVFVPLDIPLNEPHKVVVRWSLEQTNATVWVDPISESSMVNRADSADTSLPGAFSAYNVCLREGSASQSAGTLNFDNLLIGTAYTDVATVGGPPVIGGIASQNIPMNSNTGPIPVFIDSASYSPASLTLSGTSANTTLVPDANITFGGSGQNRTVTATPATGQQGSTVISVVVTDAASQTATNSFTVTVGAPIFVTGVTDQNIPTNTPTAALPFTVWDNETPNGLNVTATSSNPTLVQNTDITIVGTGTNRTVQVTPELNQAGITTITLTVSDGFTSASTAFNVDVYPYLGVLLSDSFTYPDGDVVSGSAGKWVAHSGADSNDCLIVNNQLRVSSTNAEDVHANFNGSAYAPANSGIILYSKFTVNFAKLPSGSGGGYFAHYKDLGTSNFRARVFAETNGAATGKFRIGIGNGGFTVAAVPQDLSLGTTYTVVTRYNVSAASSTVWVNPHSESSAGATATDVTAPIEIDSYCFRQDSTSPTAGVIFVDDLVIGTAFSDVLSITPPSPIALGIAINSGNAVLTWANPAFNLQSAPSVNGPWTMLPDATTGYSTTITPAQQYFRLFYYQ